MYFRSVFIRGQNFNAIPVKLFNELEQNHRLLISNHHLNYARLEFVEQSNFAWFNRKVGY